MKTHTTASHKDTTTHSRSQQNEASRHAGPFFSDTKKAEEPFFEKEKGIQPKLELSAPNTPHEHEADKVADQVVDQLHSQNGVGKKPADKSLKPSIQPLSTPNSVNRKPAFESESPLEQAELDSTEEGALQMKTEQSSPPPDHSVPDSVAQGITATSGQGQSLASNTQQEMEDSIGSDFSSVQVHADANAAQMNRQLGAKAFTHGNDIYFGQGQYQPGTKDGDHLLAHELTHTVQQGDKGSSSLQRQVDTNNPRTTNEDEFASPEEGTINKRNKTIRIPTLQIPDFKTSFTPSTNLTIPKKTDEPRPSNQAQVWDQAASGQTDYTDALEAKLQMEEAPAHTVSGLPVYFLKLKRAQENFVIGNQTAVKNRSSRPFWNIDGQRVFYDVDHKRELQLGGSHTLGNMWLLESEANQSSGRAIKDQKNAKIRALLSEAAQGEAAIFSAPPDLDQVRREYTITFETVSGGLATTGRDEEFYEFSDIVAGDQLAGLQNMTKEEVEAAGLQGDPNSIILFTNASGGGMRTVPWGEADGTVKQLEQPIRIGRNLTIQSITYTRGQGGSVSGEAFRANRETNIIETANINLDIAEMAGIEYGGYISQASIDRELKSTLVASIASPISLSEVTLQPEEGIVATGKILPNLPFLNDSVEIDLIIDGNGARLQKTFSSGELDVPAPFAISNSSLTVSVGTDGVNVTGEVNFAINRVGEGKLEGGIGSDGKLSASGQFDFDSELFDPARVNVEYENGSFAVSGTIGITRGKVRGIASASATVNYSEGSLSAEGEAELDIRGVEQGALSLEYSGDTFLIGGDFQLSDEIPGIRSGSVAVTVERTPEEGYQISASGSAVPDIPGIDSSLSVAYEAGILTIEGSVAYEYGLLSGTVDVGATNSAVGDDGQPTGEDAGRFRVYGGGTLTLELTPWLQATAGVHFLPNGEIEVTGRIGIPSTVDVFPRRSIERNLFSMPTIEIPIFAIPLGPRSIGLVATINGGLDFEAGFGPGQLQELYGEVTYNPARPEETTLAGGGRFVIPADAGLTLRADLGLGVSVGIASLTGGIEAAGNLGLEGEAAAEVGVNWNPQDGLSLNARGSITVNPKFTFDINLLARASLDLFLFELSEEWRYNLYSFDWGPDIQFGIVFPVEYVEGEPFDLSFEDIEVIKPDLDIGDMAVGLAGEIKDRVF
jgi:hypothetical protein